ncbi:MAG: alpha/beta hydrolase [Deltaproteobacteria bacterium]|nr:alpha/beta hydrolase [Deltaproteobacteria bacterium]
MPVFTTPDGVRLNYQISGSGKPLLFLHGWTMCSRVWRYQVEWFARNYQVITLDLRGHGKSESPNGDYSFQILAQDINYFIEGLQLKGLTLIGWSLAVSLILELCDSHLSNIDSLVLVDGTPVFVANKTFSHGLPYPKVKRMLKLVDSDFTQALGAFHDLLLTEEEAKIENRDEIWDLLTNENYLPRQEVARALLVSLYNEDLRGKIETITVPTLLMHGGQDKICLPGAARYMKEHLRHVEMTIFPEAGHAPFLTQADTFNQKLGNFLVSLKVTINRGDRPR